MAITSRLVVLLALAGLVASEEAFYPQRKRDQFRVLYEWNTLDFAWPNNTARQNSITSGGYIPENVLVSGIKHFGDKLYMTLPRMKAGVPATLATIPISPINNITSPVFTPFPSWELNSIGDCSAFQSVQSMEIDRNGIMWILDNGKVSTLKPDPNATICKPSLSLVDLKTTTGSSVRFTFPENVVSAYSYLNDIVLDDTGTGYAYITDNSVMDPGIIVFSRGDNRSWKLREANSMRAAFDASSFNVNGTAMQSSVNVDGIALGPRYVGIDRKVDRNVYFSPLASFKLYSVSTSALRNETIISSPASMTMQLIRELGIKPSQTDGMIMDEDGYLIYGLVGNYSIAQWNSMTNFATEQVIIAKDPNYIQWTDRFAFDDVGNLYVVINRLNNFVSGKVDANQTNYRILKSHVGVRSYMYGPTEQQVLEVYKINQAPPSKPHRPANVHRPHAPAPTPGGGHQLVGHMMTVFLAFICVSVYHK